MFNQFADYLRKRIRERSLVISGAVSSGAMKSYDEYMYSCGKIEGLAMAESELNELMLAYTKESND